MNAEKKYQTLITMINGAERFLKDIPIARVERCLSWDNETKQVLYHNLQRPLKECELGIILEQVPHLRRFVQNTLKDFDERMESVELHSEDLNYFQINP